MKKILVSLLLLVSTISMFADVTVYGEVKGSATSSFSKESADGQDSEVEARIGAKGTLGVTYFDVQLKATDYGFNGDYIVDKEKGDDSERTYPFFEQAYFRTNIAEYLELDDIIFNITAGIFKVESLRKARYSKYENEDISVHTRSKGRDKGLKVRVSKDWTSPNIMLNIGTELVRFRGGLNIEETNSDLFEYLAGFVGEVGPINYEAYYFGSGLIEEDDDSQFGDAIMVSIYSDKLDLANIELEAGLNYVYSIESELNRFGVGTSISEETFLPLELSLALDGAYNADSELLLYDLAVDVNAKVNDFITIFAGSVIDFRDYSEEATQPNILRLLDFCANFKFGKSEFGIGYAHIFDYDDATVAGNQTAETLFSYAEDALQPNLYINIKTKF